MRPPLLAAIAISVTAAALARAAPPETTPARKAEHAPAARTRIVILDEVRGEQGSPASRAALREAIGRHLGRRGFQVVDGGKRFAFRLQPRLLLLDVQNGSTVEVKASVVALDRKGKVAAMVEGGARVRATSPATATPALEAQALEAAARILAEDLAPRLVEAR